MRFMAIDIGASSGRHMAGEIVKGKLVLEELYRFENGVKPVEGKLCWDLDNLFDHVLTGLKMGGPVHYVGIDTWGVDFVLLDKDDNRLGPDISYRQYTSTEADKCLYEKTAIQYQPFNTYYQLMDRDLSEAETFLMIPDYLSFLLTGYKYLEKTNLSTSQLLGLNGDLDLELLEDIGVSSSIFPQVKNAGTVLGKASNKYDVGYEYKVIMTATHDTASAFLAAPNQANSIILSSGTWSLLGLERQSYDVSDFSKDHNFTNEVGYEGIRYLKNIMGLWMIQCIQKEHHKFISFEDLCIGAEKEIIETLIDVNHERFISPDSMISEVKASCKESGQAVPENIYQIARVVYRSLAKAYADAISDLENHFNSSFDCIHIIGGGAKADYLNRLTAEFSKKTVLAGPIEATATGNILTQMMAVGHIDKDNIHSLIRESFEIKEYKYEV
ncbi:rhamnulokinase [Acidaminobacter sp. JC074]|uniref:rhamnulokinase n=1 Tax=Acidaminobacter sp. JC074 TaxID=2530199 RepID=UPI001F0DA826|nr:FGGY-family carbohydrate kinase [Acidaminobacter sp. JC074]MCH4887040.1 rhamnulokinase [Acidaminobacter sp. JC074]